MFRRTNNRIFHVDSFTDAPFRGNPAAVCLFDGPADEAWMQNIASEMNLSETAFVWKDGDRGFGLRWFTPEAEADLCGHATLAAAHVLWDERFLERNEAARFLTRSGLLTAEFKDGCIEMDFPSEPAAKAEAPEALARALGVKPVFTGRNRLDYLVEMESEEMVKGLEPDLRLLKSIPARGFVVTARASSKGFDFISRFFAPGAGIDEDPVTGSAHCALGPYWSGKIGKDRLTGYQASKRGGVVGLKVMGGRVLLMGRAVTVLKGELAVGPGLKW